MATASFQQTNGVSISDLKPHRLNAQCPEGISEADIANEIFEIQHSLDINYSNDTGCDKARLQIEVDNERPLAELSK
jgi:hypothetical protein